MLQGRISPNFEECFWIIIYMYEAPEIYTCCFHFSNKHILIWSTDFLNSVCPLPLLMTVPPARTNITFLWHYQKAEKFHVIDNKANRPSKRLQSSGHALADPHKGSDLSLKPFPGMVFHISHISPQIQPFQAALSNLICFKSWRSHRIISGLESSENRCAALLSTPVLFKGAWLGTR